MPSPLESIAIASRILTLCGYHAHNRIPPEDAQQLRALAATPEERLMALDELACAVVRRELIHLREGKLTAANVGN